ncbi:MAG: hypothetical protein NTX84_02425 [Nitrospirae bacterium]|nr:hypothetical protein [Nitrospirota bacterium]
MAINDSRITNNAPFPALDALLLLIILSFTLQPLTEPDFGWHLRTGLDLLQHGGALPALDPYSHTMPDWPWVEHAWLTDLVIGVFYSLFGASGVILFFAVVTAGAWLAASFTAPCSRTYRLMACALSLWVALPFLGARTQMVTLLGLAVLLVILERSRTRGPRVLWLIPPLFLLWANVHGGFTAGLFLLGLVAASSVIVRGVVSLAPGFAARLDEALLSWPAIGRLIVVAGGAALVTLVNPYGWRLYGEIIDSLSNQFMLTSLQEWQPVSLSTLAGRGYAIYVAGLGLATAAWYRRIEPVRWMLWVVFLVLSLRHMRNIPFFLLVSLPLCAELLATGWGNLTGWSSLDPVHAKKWLLAGTLAGGLFMAWLGPDHLQHVAQAGLQPNEYFKGTAYPIEAVQWVRDHRDRVGHRLYNDYAYGGFLLWWLPEEKIFIDGRMPAWRSGDRRIFQDYVALSLTDPPSLSVLSAYSVDWAIVRRGSLLDEALAREQDWRREYEDEKVSIYVQRRE